MNNKEADSQGLVGTVEVEGKPQHHPFFYLSIQIQICLEYDMKCYSYQSVVSHTTDFLWSYQECLFYHLDLSFT